MSTKPTNVYARTIVRAARLNRTLRVMHRDRTFPQNPEHDTDNLRLVKARRIIEEFDNTCCMDKLPDVDRRKRGVTPSLGGLAGDMAIIDAVWRGTGLPIDLADGAATWPDSHMRTLRIAYLMTQADGGQFTSQSWDRFMWAINERTAIGGNEHVHVEFELDIWSAVPDMSTANQKLADLLGATSSNPLNNGNTGRIGGAVADPRSSSTTKPQTPTPEANKPEKASNDMSTNTTSPANFDEIMGALSQVPALVQENSDLKKQMVELQVKHKQAMSDANKINGERAQLAEQLEETRAKLKEAKANGSGQQVVKLAVDDHSPSAGTNDLAAIATALGIDVPELEAQMTAFKQSCAIRLPNDVDWPDWCDPTKPFSKAPFMFRTGRPVVCTGPSGTGKTFLLEALAHHYSNVRKLITYHQNLTEPKLFLKEKVGAGRTYWQLGPIPMAVLCGVPIIHDEFDHADTFVQSLVHTVLDTNQVHLPQIGIVINAAEGSKHLFTCNSLSDGDGDYHGEVGTALKTRFGAIFVGYPDQRAETNTIKTASGAPAKIATTIAKAFASLRAAEQEQRLTGPFSVRESCNVGKFVVQAMDDGASQGEALALAFDLYVVDKRPVEEQLVAREVLAQCVGAANADDFLAKLEG